MSGILALAVVGFTLWLDGERRASRYLLACYIVLAAYGSGEAHDHIHKLHNEVAGYEVYTDNGVQRDAD